MDDAVCAAVINHYATHSISFFHFIECQSHSVILLATIQYIHAVPDNDILVASPRHLLSVALARSKSTSIPSSSVPQSSQTSTSSFSAQDSETLLPTQSTKPITQSSLLTPSGLTAPTSAPSVQGTSTTKPAWISGVVIGVLVALLLAAYFIVRYKYRKLPRDYGRKSVASDGKSLLAPASDGQRRSSVISSVATPTYGQREDESPPKRPSWQRSPIITSPPVITISQFDSSRFKLRARLLRRKSFSHEEEPISIPYSSFSPAASTVAPSVASCSSRPPTPLTTPLITPIQTSNKLLKSPKPISPLSPLALTPFSDTASTLSFADSDPFRRGTPRYSARYSLPVTPRTPRTPRYEKFLMRQSLWPNVQDVPVKSPGGLQAEARVGSMCVSVQAEEESMGHGDGASSVFGSSVLDYYVDMSDDGVNA